MVVGLVGELLRSGEIEKVVVTLNVPEQLDLPIDGRLSVRCNERPRGYGANHNAAFAGCNSRFFCALNPDLRLPENPFPALLGVLSAPHIGVAAPCITDPEGKREDSARRFPTVACLLAKACGADDGTYPEQEDVFYPDWMAGMFLLLRSEAFAKVGGFDEKFFLYYEDVDLCLRLRRAGYEVAQVPGTRAIHSARRQSRRDWTHARQHIASMARYILKDGFFIRGQGRRSDRGGVSP
jgi:GT2 family glycosyltransferase